MWIDRGHFWEHNAKQGTDAWKEARIGRINSSTSGAMADQSKFKTAEQSGKIIAGIEEENFTMEALERMEFGVVQEPTARMWYEKTHKCKVLERGLCVPKNNFIIGASVDGDVLNTEGIVEIKCPKEMYFPIVKYMENQNFGWKPEPGYHSHIWDTHYAQMQHGMHVLKKKWCDYIVYSPPTGQVFTQRFYYDPKYWKSHYAKIKENYDLYIKPYLPSNYPLKNDLKILKIEKKK